MKKQLLIAAASLAALAPLAQTTVPSTSYSVVFVGSQTINIDDYHAGSVDVTSHSRLTYSASADDWIKTSLDANGKLTVSVGENDNDGPRRGTVNITASNGQTTSISVVQNGFGLATVAKDAQAAYRVYPTKATGTVAQSGYSADLTIDGDYSTYYHSNWNGFTANDQSTCPKLYYMFDENGVDIGSIKYWPRQDGSINGNFGNVIIWVKQKGDDSYQESKSFQYDFKQSSGATTVTLPESLQKSVVAIRFYVLDGAADNGKCFASCSEMEFYNPEATGSNNNDYNLFTDNVLSALKSGTKQKDVDAMTDPFLKSLAQLMLDGTYTSAGRVHTIAPSHSLNYNSNLYRAKQSDQYHGVTGVMLTKGTYAVMVEGLPEGETTNMLSVAWYVPDGLYDSRWFRTETFALQNGLNIITKTEDLNSLAYIQNFSDDENPSSLKVHIIGGFVNGYVSNDKTNDENQAVMDNACYEMMDMVSSCLHGVWETSAMKAYNRGRYMQMMNLYDTNLMWIYRMIGLEKANIVPSDRMLCYVNFNGGYASSGGIGVTVHADYEYEWCDPDMMLVQKNVWAFSHEFGHHFQIYPYFRWGGTTECTNNMCTLHNVMHIGNYPDRIPNNRASVQKKMIQDNLSGVTLLSTPRMQADTAAQNGTFDYNAEFKTLARTTDMWTITKTADNEDYGMCIHECGVEEILAPLWQLYNYFCEPTQTARLSADDYQPDFYSDLYQSLRTTDAEGKSDKYQLIASAQNSNSGSKYAELKSTYPTSSWVTKNYVTSSSWASQNVVPFILNYVRQASILSGYNLYDYFNKFGFFRTIAMEIGDYGTYYYIMTKSMKDEFKADMEALNLKPCTDELLNAINSAPYIIHDTPTIPNDRPIRSDEI